MTHIAIDTCLILPMTIHTESHVIQHHSRGNLFHRGYVPVASFAVDPFGNVGIMIEENKIGYPVHFHPLDRLLALPCLPDFDNLRLGCSNELVTAHAHLHRRKRSARTPPYSTVTVLTSNLVVAGMNCVAKSNGLARSRFLAPATGGGEHDAEDPEHDAIQEMKIE